LSGLSVCNIGVGYCGETVGWIKMPLGTEVGLGPCHTGYGDPAPPPKEKGTATSHFAAHVSCGKTAGWIRIPLGADVGLSLDYVVLDGEGTPPPRKGHSSPSFFSAHCSVSHPRILPITQIIDGAQPLNFGSLNFRPMSVIRPNVWMDQDTTWYVGLGPGHCVTWGPSSPPRKGIHFSVDV